MAPYQIKYASGKDILRIDGRSRYRKLRVTWVNLRQCRKNAAQNHLCSGFNWTSEYKVETGVILYLTMHINWKHILRTGFMVINSLKKGVKGHRAHELMIRNAIFHPMFYFNDIENRLIKLLISPYSPNHMMSEHIFKNKTKQWTLEVGRLFVTRTNIH